MKPIDFKERNVIIAKDQPEYIPLPAHRFESAVGRIVCCWRLTWRERICVLLRGVLWQQILTFNTPLQPQILTTEKPPMEDQ